MSNILEIKDPHGAFIATVKPDGCTDYTQYYNEPFSEREEDQDYLHICDIDLLIERLQSIKQQATAHYDAHWSEQQK